MHEFRIQARKRAPYKLNNTSIFHSRRTFILKAMELKADSVCVRLNWNDWQLDCCLVFTLCALSHFCINWMNEQKISCAMNDWIPWTHEIHSVGFNTSYSLERISFGVAGFSRVIFQALVQFFFLYFHFNKVKEKKNSLKMVNYHKPESKTVQELRDIAHRLRIHSITSTQASKSG